jgi:hypothetical protein
MDFLLLGLKVDPAERASADAILNHKWLNE